MHIDIIVDTICPWCYVGKRHFEKALELRPVAGLSVGWRPFQLNPNMAVAGKDRDVYIDEKFGDASRAEKIQREIGEAGAREGIEFRFDRIARTPNTVNSHRLIAHAGRPGAQDDIVEALFHAYFTDGRDVGDISVLADIAAETGLDRADTYEYLASDRDRDAVLADDDMARTMGVNGVPCYIVDRKYAVSGAQSPEVFVQVLDLAHHDAADQPVEQAAE